MCPRLYSTVLLSNRCQNVTTSHNPAKCGFSRPVALRPMPSPGIKPTAFRFAVNTPQSRLSITGEAARRAAALFPGAHFRPAPPQEHKRSGKQRNRAPFGLKRPAGPAETWRRGGPAWGKGGGGDTQPGAPNC